MPHQLQTQASRIKLHSVSPTVLSKISSRLPHISNCPDHSFLLQDENYINLHCSGFCFLHPHETINYMLERIPWPTLLKAFGFSFSRCAAWTGALCLVWSRIENIPLWDVKTFPHLAFQRAINELNSPVLPLLTNLTAAINAIPILFALIIEILPCDCGGTDLQGFPYHWEQAAGHCTPQGHLPLPHVCALGFL